MSIAEILYLTEQAAAWIAVLFALVPWEFARILAGRSSVRHLAEPLGEMADRGAAGENPGKLPWDQSEKDRNPGGGLFGQIENLSNAHGIFELNELMNTSFRA